MIDLIKKYLSKDRREPKPEIQEYTIIGDSSLAIDIVQTAANQYMKFYNQINIFTCKSETNDTYTVWIKNRDSKSLDDAWYFGIDPNSLSENYINICLNVLKESINKVLGRQKIKSIKYKNENHD